MTSPYTRTARREAVAPQLSNEEGPPTFRPQPGPQEAFLSSSADVVFFGGAAGGGKTYALLLEPLRHIMTVRNYGAVVFRRETPQITNEGGMWDEATQIYPYFDARPRLGYLDWTFPPYGNTIKFAHMEQEDDYLNWKGSQIALIAFDQGEDFTRKQVLYMFSRNRSVSGVKPYIRLTYNPIPPDEDPGGWIHEFVGWYLDDKGEYPNPQKTGVIRWFINLKDQLYWFDTRDDAVQFAIDKEVEDADAIPKSFTFIPAYVQDNRELLSKDPGYLANLYALDNIDHERLLRGNHKIRPSAGTVYKREWYEIVDYMPDNIDMEVRFWDIAASEQKRRKHRKPATAGVRMARTLNGHSPNGDPLYTLYVVDCVEQQFNPAQTDTLLRATAEFDDTHVKQRFELQPGAAGKRDALHIVQLLMGYDVEPVQVGGDKLTRGRAFAAQSKARNVKLLRGDWNDAWLTHMHAIPDGLRWDIHDATTGAANELMDAGTGSVVQQGHIRGRRVRRGTRRVSRVMH